MTNEQIVKLANAIDEIFSQSDECEKDALLKECCALRAENEALREKLAQYEVQERLNKLLSDCKDIAATAARMLNANTFVEDLTRRI